MEQTVRILVVDDEPDIRNILRILLEAKGYTVLEANNGRTAVQVVRRQPELDLIIMDIMMPELSGLDATRRIRRSAHPQAQTIPIIAVTANAFASDVRAALDAGMNEHIAKPLDSARLYAVLQRYCGNK